MRLIGLYVDLVTAGRKMDSFIDMIICRRMGLWNLIESGHRAGVMSIYSPTTQVRYKLCHRKILISKTFIMSTYCIVKRLCTGQSITQVIMD